MKKNKVKCKECRFYVHYEGNEDGVLCTAPGDELKPLYPNKHGCCTYFRPHPSVAIDYKKISKLLMDYQVFGDYALGKKLTDMVVTTLQQNEHRILVDRNLI